MDMDKWFEKAKEAIWKLPYGKRFEVRQLFKEVEWNTLTRGERINFGKYFKNEVIEGNIQEVRFIDRGKNNHSKYEKVEE